MGYVLTNLISNGNFAGGNTWSTQNSATLDVVTISTDSTLSAAGTPSTAAEKALRVKSGSAQYGQAVYSISGQSGHKYYFRADAVKPDNTKEAGIQLQLVASPYTAYGEDNRETSWDTWQTLSCIAEVGSTASLYACLSVNRSDTTSGLYAYYTNVLLVDLTASFGAGNEPELEWCNENIGYFDGSVDENGNVLLPPAGDHNTRIDGTSCEIESGQVLIGGTVYEIEKGVVLIGGTEYEIPLIKPCVITITGTTNSTYAYVTVNESDKLYQTGTYEYDWPFTMTVTANGQGGAGVAGSGVTLNGTTVQNRGGTYTMDLQEKPKTITVAFTKTTPSTSNVAYTADITTT